MPRSNPLPADEADHVAAAEALASELDEFDAKKDAVSAVVGPIDAAARRALQAHDGRGAAALFRQIAQTWADAGWTYKAVEYQALANEAEHPMRRRRSYR